MATRKVYIIQRASESRCEWWTGTGWTEDQSRARRYSDKPNAPEVTEDESATAELETESAVGHRPS